MTDHHTGATVASDKLELSMLKFIHEVSKVSPDRADQLMQLTQNQVRHVQRIRWAFYALRVLSVLLGFSALLVLAWTSVQFVRAGAIGPATISLGAGAGTIVALFVTGRAAGPAIHRRRDDARGRSSSKVE